MPIQIKGIHKAFKKQMVLRDINLEILDHEIFGLIGPSGAGKTTLIRIITGALPADSGQVTIEGHKIPSFEALKLIGYMPQNDALYVDLTGYDNLMFYGSMYGMSHSELKKRADEVLRLVDLEQDSRKRVSLYSGGMKKRLSLSVSLLHQPRLLILDEPTVGIDPLLRKRIWDEFEALKAHGTTILVTTHVMDEAEKCDRLSLIYDGGIIACDSVQALLDRTSSRSIEELFFTNGVKEA